MTCWECLHLFPLLREHCENKTAALTKVSLSYDKQVFLSVLRNPLSVWNMYTLCGQLSNARASMKAKSCTPFHLCHKSSNQLENPKDVLVVVFSKKFVVKKFPRLLDSHNPPVSAACLTYGTVSPSRRSPNVNDQKLFL